MIKYLSSLNVNIFTKNNSRFMKIAINSSYTQDSKNFKNGGLLGEHIYFKNNFYNLFLIHFLQNDDYNCIVSTHKIIHIMSNNLPFNLYVIQYFIYRLLFIIFTKNNSRFMKIAIDSACTLKWKFKTIFSCV